MNESIVKSAKLAFFETLERGQDVRKLVLSAWRNEMVNQVRSQITRDIFSGTLGALINTYATVEKLGHVPQYSDAEFNKFMHQGPSSITLAMGARLSEADRPWLGRVMMEMIACIEDAGLKFQRQQDTVQLQAAGQPQTISLQINMAQQEAAAQPLEVRVVGMPERVRESSVSYDQDGNVESTTQVERDAATA